MSLLTEFKVNHHTSQRLHISTDVSQWVNFDSAPLSSHIHFKAEYFIPLYKTVSMELRNLFLLLALISPLAIFLNLTQPRPNFTIYKISISMKNNIRQYKFKYYIFSSLIKHLAWSFLVQANNIWIYCVIGDPITLILSA